MQTEEVITVRGDVVITLHHEDGTKDVQEYRNLVVTSGKTILAKLLAGDATYLTDYVDHIGFGTGNVAPATTDIALGMQVFSKAATVTYPAANQVTFSTTMLATEGGSSTYQEIGLLSKTTNKLFSRLVIAAITKSSAYKIQVDWTISFQ